MIEAHVLNHYLMQSSCQILEMIENIRAAAQTSGGTGTGAPNGTVLMLDSSVPSEASPEKVITILIRSGYFFVKR